MLAYRIRDSAEPLTHPLPPTRTSHKGLFSQCTTLVCTLDCWLKQHCGRRHP